MAVNKYEKIGEARKGEEIDPNEIASYLKNFLPELEGIPMIKQFRGGASNLTYQLDFENQSLILRRPPLGTKAKSAHNMAREYDVMRRLYGKYPVPKMLHLSEENSLLEGQFYVMEKLTGFIPRTNFPKELGLEARKVRELCQISVDHLVKLHQLDYEALGFGDYYRGEGYVKRQVEGWNRRFRKARTPDVPDCEFVMQWLEDKMPQDVGACLIHNDFRFDNIVYDSDDLTQVIGVLDWEMATVGDPLMDLGGSLAYWIEANDPYCLKLLRRQPTHTLGMMSRDEVVNYYLKKMGMQDVSMKYYYIFGLFRLVGIIQQIYYRYFHKQTTNPAFSTFGVAVRLLERYCTRLIKSNSESLSTHPLSLMENIDFSIQFLRSRKKG
ncbi:MAG: phosphotransferase family protein [Bacteroidia bacterium]|nr:phosphotransferase family protein [Bacteroidia bacterium]